MERMFQGTLQLAAAALLTVLVLYGVFIGAGLNPKTQLSPRPSLPSVDRSHPHSPESVSGGRVRRRVWRVVFPTRPNNKRQSRSRAVDLRGTSAPPGRKGVFRRLPQALIIGVKKGGTRALLEFLRLHPDVRAVGPETHFFDRHYHRGLDWYRNQMPMTSPEQLTMEKTPSYFVTKAAPARIRHMSADVKLLVVLRDPVTRALSDYAQTASKRPEVKDFDDLAFANATSGLVDTSWSAIHIGLYARHLERWFRFFPRERFHFVNGDGLVVNPAEEMRHVEEFLGLKPFIDSSLFFFNETKGFPCVWRPKHRGNRPHCLGKTKGRIHPNVSESTLQILRDFYRPFNDKLYKMIGINFGWM